MVDAKVIGSGKGKSSGISVAEGKKSITLYKDNKSVNLSLANEYGNDIAYTLDKSGFDDLFSNLWQFVKDRQH